jgi:hypothetical protein
MKAKFGRLAHENQSQSWQTEMQQRSFQTTPWKLKTCCRGSNFVSGAPTQYTEMAMISDTPLLLIYSAFSMKQLGMCSFWLPLK